jgi:hypothetical protein
LGSSLLAPLQAFDLAGLRLGRTFAGTRRSQQPAYCPSRE